MREYRVVSAVALGYALALLALVAIVVLTIVLDALEVLLP